MLNRILASLIAKTNMLLLYNGNIFFSAPSYDRNPQPSTSLSLVSCPVTWHCLLDHLGIEPLPAILNPSKEPVATRFVGLMVPFHKMLLNQSLVVERKCQLGVDSLLGTLLLQ